MKHRIARLALLAGFAALIDPTGAEAAPLGNLEYQASEMNAPLYFFNATTFTGNPGGSNTVLMLRDRLIVMGSSDSGVAGGPLHVFDVADPRNPVLIKRVSGTPETADLRELHAMPMAIIDGKDILVFTSTRGVRFFDFTDPTNPTPVGNLELPGANGGDYDNTVWMASWAWPYLYVSGTNNGIYVIDATDPSQPSLLTQLETGDLGGFRIGPCYAAGNYIIGSGMDATPLQFAIVDAGDPAAPYLLANGSTPQSLYSTVVMGDRIYGSGEMGNYSFMKWGPTGVEVLGTAKFGNDKGGYCTYQDANIFCGQSSEGYRKIDVSDETNFRQVEVADIPNEASADTDFATVLGNLVYVGNDHGTGAAFFPHTMTRDTTPPKLLKAFPSDGDVNQPLTTRITAFFSDEIAIDSMNSTNLIVRKVGGAALDGVYSHSSFNAISFGTRAPLEADSTYEIVVVAGGLKDLAQNTVVDEVISRFSTGATVMQPPGGGGTGAGGQAGAGGGAVAGSPSGGGGGGGGAGAGPVGGSAPAAGTSSGGSTSTAGVPGAAGTTPVTDGPPQVSGCGCRVPGAPAKGGALALLAAAVAAAIVRRRRAGGSARV